LRKTSSSRSQLNSKSQYRTKIRYTVPLALQLRRPFFEPSRGFVILMSVKYLHSFRISSRFLCVTCWVFTSFLLTMSVVKVALAAQISVSLQSPQSQQPTPAQTPVPTANGAQQVPQTPQPPGLNIVVLDPAHGGTDFGARGTGGIHESDIVLEFAGQVRAALEGQGFQVIQTRQGNANPSFDDRSAMANAQRGAIFVTLHIASTGVAGTARVYVMNDLPLAADSTGLIPWDRAQAPFISLSRKLGDLVEGNLAQRFKGSPPFAQTASVRQLRTTAAPAIAVEVSSVTVEDRAELDHMAPGVADAIARGAAAFRPSYIVPTNPGERP
jgi:N-acetylmuramoyl-L-alanine amidase